MTETTTQTEFPVGRCAGQDCGYQEPHRHGFSCDKSCECEGIGAETGPIRDDAPLTCDWGGCDRPTVAMRLMLHPPRYSDDLSLSVCGWHAGWEDFPGQADS